MEEQKGCQQPCGPGYRTPKEAMEKGPREKLMYVVCVHTDPKKPDVLSTVDIDPKSPTYCKIIHKLRMLHVGDELHHSGWNICSSCHHDTKRKRDTLVLPSLMSDRIYFINTCDERKPSIKKVLEPSEMHKHGISTPHTTHCAPTGEIIISTMGKPNGDGMGEFLRIDSQTLEVKGVWTCGDKRAKFGYDFWYQPYHDTLVSSEWGVPRVFKEGYQPTDGPDPSLYGTNLNFYSWTDHKLKQVINFGADGIAPLEVRFLHDPKACEGYVGCAVTSNVYRFYKDGDHYGYEKVIQIPPKEVEGWMMPVMPGMMTDIILSLDDKYLYFSNFLHGDVRQYDITDRRHPKLTGQIFLGGSILNDSSVRVTKDEELEKQPEPVFIKGRRLYGSPQMLQLSLDGKRLYVTASLFKPWDKQFYPEHIKHGSTMVKIDIDSKHGGMKLDKNFLVDFGADKDDILLAHEMRYPGGDCTSEIWVAEK